MIKNFSVSIMTIIMMASTFNIFPTVYNQETTRMNTVTSIKAVEQANQDIAYVKDLIGTIIPEMMIIEDAKYAIEELKHSVARALDLDPSLKFDYMDALDQLKNELSIAQEYQDVKEDAEYTLYMLPKSDSVNHDNLDEIERLIIEVEKLMQRAILLNRKIDQNLKPGINFKSISFNTKEFDQTVRRVNQLRAKPLIELANQAIENIKIFVGKVKEDNKEIVLAKIDEIIDRVAQAQAIDEHAKFDHEMLIARLKEEIKRLSDLPMTEIEDTATTTIPGTVIEDTATTTIPGTIIEDTAITTIPGTVIEDTAITTIPGIVIEDTATTTIPGTIIEDTATTTIPGTVIEDTATTTIPGTIIEDTATTTIPGTVIEDTAITTIPGTVIEDTAITTIPGTVIADTAITTIPGTIIEDTATTSIPGTVIEDTATDKISAASIDESRTGDSLGIDQSSGSDVRFETSSSKDSEEIENQEENLTLVTKDDKSKDTKLFLEESKEDDVLEESKRTNPLFLMNLILLASGATLISYKIKKP